MTAPPPDVPFLRTLAPLLRGLDARLRAWLDARRLYPVGMVRRAEIEGLAEDLGRKADALDVDRPLLVVMLMGGTGVGKSTLLNALAGAAVAQASFTRPTTRDPVVYFHQSVNPDRLDPALRLCRLVRHDRDALAQKVIVDTPDLDSNDLANRDKLVALLPVADVVLYVGSQEKYHDQLGWELFKEQRQRRAFAFVLNKWDRCVQTGPTGLRPDEDLLRDLKAEGFKSPRLFRTTAQLWLDADGRPPAADALPPGEQFAELRDWLERGLTRLEIEAVKARGVGQLLAQVELSVDGVRPPDLSTTANKVRDSWQTILEEEARVGGEVLVGSLDPHRTEIEHHFSLRGQQRFRGLMAAYLRLTTKLRYVGSTLQNRVPFAPRLGAKADDPPDFWDIAGFAHDCARSAGERVLDQRGQALVNRLLVDADQDGFPLVLLNERTAAVARLDWDDRFGRDVVEALAEVERDCTEPTGWRAYVRGAVGLLANWLPELLAIVSILILLWLFIVEQTVPTFAMLLMPVYVVAGALILLHVVISLTFPVRWAAIRDEFHRRLEEKLRAEYERAYLPVPVEVAAAVAEERRHVDDLLGEARQVSAWLAERESAARVGELYGK